jgi:hypothetical protein
VHNVPVLLPVEELQQLGHQFARRSGPASPLAWQLPPATRGGSFRGGLWQLSHSLLQADRDVASRQPGSPGICSPGALAVVACRGRLVALVRRWGPDAAAPLVLLLQLGRGRRAAVGLAWPLHGQQASRAGGAGRHSLPHLQRLEAGTVLLGVVLLQR